MGRSSNADRVNEKKSSIIAVTQSCLDFNFIPLGIVIAQSDWLDSYEERLVSLVKKLSEAAPAGTTHIFNVKWEPREYHGHHYYFGVADAYKSPTKPDLFPLKPDPFRKFKEVNKQ